MGQLRRELGETEERIAAQLAVERTEVRAILGWVKWVLEKQQPQALEEVRSSLEREREARRGRDEGFELARGHADARLDAAAKLADDLAAQVEALTTRVHSLDSGCGSGSPAVERLEGIVGRLEEAMASLEAQNEAFRVAVEERLQSSSACAGGLGEGSGCSTPARAGLVTTDGPVKARNTMLCADIANALDAQVQALGSRMNILKNKGCHVSYAAARGGCATTKAMS